MNLDRLLKNLDKKEYKNFKKLPIHKGSDNIVFDYIIVSRYGVFPIDIVDHVGTVYGSEKDKEWKIYTKNNGIYKFSSPIETIYKKINKLNSIFSDVEQDAYNPIVIFPNKAKLMVENVSIPVINKDYLVTAIKRFRDVAINDLKFNYLIQIFPLFKTNKSNFVIPRLFKKEKEEPKIEKCPLCNSPLIYKEGEFGDYYICSNFPACRYRQEA